MVDCENVRERRVLEFLVLILNPDRPTRVTVTLAHTIFGALSGDRKVNWGIVFKELIARMVAVVGKSKPSGLSPYLFHLYESNELLLDKERIEYKAAEVMLKYDIGQVQPEEGDKDEGESEPEGEEETST